MHRAVDTLCLEGGSGTFDEVVPDPPISRTSPRQGDRGPGGQSMMGLGSPLERHNWSKRVNAVGWSCVVRIRLWYAGAAGYLTTLTLSHRIGGWGGGDPYSLLPQVPDPVSKVGWQSATRPLLYLRQAKRI